MDFENFISPLTGQKFVLKNNILESKAGEKIQILNKIPRFAPEDNYTSAFGRQWKIYSEVQLDSKNKTTLSEDRISIALGKSLDSKIILPVESSVSVLIPSCTLTSYDLSDSRK